MATRSFIGYLCPVSGQIMASYCHSDGYPSGVGAGLLAFYNNSSLAEEIASAGYLSALLGDFASSLAYARHEQPPSVYENLLSYYAASGDVSYAYLWANGAWYLVDRGPRGSCRPRLRLLSGIPGCLPRVAA